ncbi:MAG TPA: hypothetical protein VHK90_08660 [Thermoanaerobaculia bacterium]|nr:hypothetical protein [Thermoanaerobaculia bacterium]
MPSSMTIGERWYAEEMVAFQRPFSAAGAPKKSSATARAASPSGYGSTRT